MSASCMSAAPWHVPTLLDSRAVSELLGVKPSTLAQWRLNGGGPPFVKLGARCVRYRPEVVAAWINSLPNRLSTCDLGHDRAPVAH